MVAPSVHHQADELEHGLLLFRLCSLILVHVTKQEGGIRPWVRHPDEVDLLEGSWSPLCHRFKLLSDV